MSIEISDCEEYKFYNEEWICEKCLLDYRVDCSGNCCVSNKEKGFIKVGDNLIVCISEIPHCL
jgi:hypothetical protein